MKRLFYTGAEAAVVMLEHGNVTLEYGKCYHLPVDNGVVKMLMKSNLLSESAPAKKESGETEQGAEATGTGANVEGAKEPERVPTGHEGAE